MFKSKNSNSNNSSLSQFYNTKFDDKTDSDDEDYMDIEDGDLSDQSDDEKELDNKGFKLNMSDPKFSMITSNIEKFGKSTDLGVKKKKVENLGKIANVMQPDIMMFQEVTDPNLLFDGKKTGWKKNRFDGLSDVQTDFSKLMEKAGTPKNETLGDQYQMLNGPKFQSGNYKESYSVMYNNALFHQKPKQMVEKKNKNNRTFVPLSEDKTLKFGKKDNKPRPNTKWEFNIPTDRYNLRPPKKDFYDPEQTQEYQDKHQNLKHRKPNYQPMSLVNVHTSPSITTINKQAKDIMSSGDSMVKNNENVILGGDFYMQKSAKTEFKKLKNSKQWQLGAPKNNTNYPGQKKSGQVADMFVANQSSFNINNVNALPPVNDEFATKEDMLTKKKSKKDLSKWLDSNIDHTPVYGDFTFNNKNKK